MNVLPFAGYFFYGAVNTEQRVSFYCSFGLLADAPDYTPPVSTGTPTFLLGILRKR